MIEPTKTPQSSEIPPLLIATLYICFILSGIAGLIYEVLWAKYLALYVGSTGLAQIIVLATFMGGLALGSHWLGRLVDRVASPLKMYAFLEFGIGVYALLFDQIFGVGRTVFIGLARWSGISAGGLILGKTTACVLCILVPTFLMGGTLPALTRHMIRSIQGVGPRFSRLYFLNSLGAVFGCLIAGFYLIRTCGLQFSMIIGAGVNILVGLIALIVESRETISEPETGRAGGPAPSGAGQGLPRWAVRILLSAICLSGGISMLYEVSWIRLLTLVLGSSTYAFSLMLATFIFGLAIGSFLLSFRTTQTGYILIFALTEAAVGLTVLLMLPFYVKLPFIFNQLASSLSREPATFGLYQFCTFSLCALVMFLPTVLQGVTLPAAIKAITFDVHRLGRNVGFAYAINTWGTLAGSVAAGFLGLPFLGIKGTLELAVAMNCVLGLAILLAEPDARVRSRFLVATLSASVVVWVVYAATMGAWDREVLSAGVYRTRSRIPSYAALLKEAQRRIPVFYRDGIDATIAVADIKDPEPERLLIINGKVDASTSKDMATQKLMAHLPMLLHPRPRRILIVGVGSGATIGSVLAYDSATDIDVVELSRDVIEASRLFDTVNGRYWEDPRVRIYWEDAKTFLQVTDKQYDLIISEPTNPWIAGVAGVFSKEYFETCRSRLAPGGVFVQWIQSYELEDSTFYMMLETFNGIFPCYTLWNTTSADTILIGSPSPYRPDFARMETRLQAPKVLDDLNRLRIGSLLPILGLQMADHAGVPAPVRWLGVVHSDYFPILEYVAPRGFFVGSSAAGVKWLDGRSQSPVNARLWVQSYLKDHKPSAAELRNCYVFAGRCPNLYDRSAAIWAREWLNQFPDDVEARFAVGETAQPSHDTLIRDIPLDLKGSGPWGALTAKARCRQRFADYTAQRNFLSEGPAHQTLSDIDTALQNYPTQKDGDLYAWRGQIEYDLGRYSNAASNLHVAAKLYFANNRVKDVIDVGLLLCECLLAQGDTQNATAAHKAVLGQYPDDLRVWLMAARIRDTPAPLK